MITEAILNIFMIIPQLIIGLLPTINYTLPTDLFDTVTSVFYGLGYVLPLVRLAPIIAIDLALSTFKIVVAIVIRCKSFIPTMGGT